LEPFRNCTFDAAWRQEPGAHDQTTPPVDAEDRAGVGGAAPIVAFRTPAMAPLCFDSLHIRCHGPPGAAPTELPDMERLPGSKAAPSFAVRRILENILANSLAGKELSSTACRTDSGLDGFPIVLPRPLSLDLFAGFPVH